MMPYSAYELKLYAERLLKYAARLLELCDDIEDEWEFQSDYDSIYTKVRREEKQLIGRLRYGLEESEEEAKLWDELLKSITQVTE